MMEPCGITSQRGIVHYKSPAFFFFLTTLILGSTSVVSNLSAASLVRSDQLLGDGKLTTTT